MPPGFPIRGALSSNTMMSRAGRLRLDPSVLIVHFDHTEDFPVKLERSFRALHRQGDVGDAIRLDHTSNCRAFP